MILQKRPAFFRDVDRYASQIAKHNPDAARRFISAAEIACQQLLKHPEIGHQEAFRRIHGIRSWRVQGFERYLIFYRQEGEIVEIIRLLHGAQDLPEVLRLELSP